MRARVCVLLETIETWHGLGKGRLLREEGCVQSCNTAPCQGSFVSYLRQDYFHILSFCRLRISLPPLCRICITEKLGPEWAVFRGDCWEERLCVSVISASPTWQERCLLKAYLVVPSIQWGCAWDDRFLGRLRSLGTYWLFSYLIYYWSFWNFLCGNKCAPIYFVFLQHGASRNSCIRRSNFYISRSASASFFLWIGQR